MKTVNIEIRGIEESQRELEFLQWKNDGKGFYARSQNGQPLVVALTPAWPEPPDKTYMGDLRYQTLPDGWQEKAYGPGWKFPPVRIVPCWLVTPPIRGSGEEWQAIREFIKPEGEVLSEFTEPEQWELRYLQTNREPLYLQPDDDEPLKKILAERSQEKLESAVKDWRDTYNLEVAEFTRITDEDLREKLGGKLLSSVEIEDLRKELLSSVEIDNQALNDPLEMARRGMLGIRDDYLRERWAVAENVKLPDMERWRRELFRKFRTDYHGDQDSLFKCLCASVAFRIEWEDDAAYLTGCGLRNLRPEEIDEVRRSGYAIATEESGARGEEKAEVSAGRSAEFAAAVLPVKFPQPAPRWMAAWKMKTLFDLTDAHWKAMKENDKIQRKPKEKANGNDAWNVNDALEVWGKILEASSFNSADVNEFMTVNSPKKFKEKYKKWAHLVK